MLLLQLRYRDTVAAAVADRGTGDKRDTRLSQETDAPLNDVVFAELHVGDAIH